MPADNCSGTETMESHKWDEAQRRFSYSYRRATTGVTRMVTRNYRR